jgi:biopolymer transport protein ExbD
MSTKAPTFDVWLVELNKVYRAVPFAVVCDWVQQGRLLDDDRARPTGTEEWRRIGDLPQFRVYLAPPEPQQPEDVAAALEPVEGAFQWKPPRHDEDEDVDMIPLIDVSLVLLIFFMLTASVTAGANFAGLPPTSHGDVTAQPTKVWVGVYAVEQGRGRDRTRVYFYSVGVDDRAAEKDNRDLRSAEDAVERLKTLLPKTGPPVELTIFAQADVPSGLVRQLTVKLEARDIRDRISKKFTGVTWK